MKKALLACAFFAAANLRAGAQNRSDTIPFSLNSQNNICIKARINGSDTLTLMFHSSSTGVTMTRAAVDQKLPLKNMISTEVKTWGGTAEGEFSEGNSLIINGLRWDSLTVFINENCGAGTDGKFGFDLFAGKILAIDYDKMWMVVHPALPKLSKKYRREKLIIKNGSTFIEGSLKIGKAVYRDTFMFHTGYGGTVLLDPKIGENLGAPNLKTIATSELTDAYGNVFKIETKSLPELLVGGKKLKNVPLSFAARSSAIPMKVFGNGLLRRFNVVFDFRENEVYLMANGFWGKKFQ